MYYDQNLINDADIELRENHKNLIYDREVEMYFL